MKKIFKIIILKTGMEKFLIKFLVFLHNCSYNYISSIVMLEQKGKHPKHRILNYHKFFIDNINKEDVILDIGCGNGMLTNSISQKAKMVIGIEKVGEKVEQSSKNFKKDNIRFVQGDATKYDFSLFNIDNFDKIVLSNVLEHIDDRINFLKSLHKLSNTILIRVPMITRDWITVYKKENNYKYKLDPTHFIEYTEDGLKKELDESGWNLESFSIQFGELWGVIKIK
ncbi:class I SAM-dependent methyltransferase [bacterium]|nr:class I SAM-dependent methyltransferase [bacterium]